jgi:alkylation response protein AidB-like acyl-CoA dehydrogenase
MDFKLSDEQQLLKDSAERFVREAYTFEKRQRLVATDSGYSEDNWRQMAELGWLGAAMPEAFGGIGGGALETMVLMEALGAGLVTEPYLPCVVMGGGLVATAGSDELKGEILPALIGGTCKLAFAYAERSSGYDLYHLESTATPRDGGFVLNGTKGVVLGADCADHIIVSARSAGDIRDPQGIGLFLVDRDAAGLTLRPYATVDGLRAAEVMLDDVSVDGNAVLGDAAGAWPAIDLVADQAVAALCAEAVGAMDAVVNTTRDYLNTREQFGRPISRFQVLQHQLADMVIAAQESRSMMIVATLKLSDPDAAQRTRAVSGAKHLIGKHARMIGQRAVQLHGGMGMTEEMSVGHYFKRLTMIEMMLGDSAWHLKRYAGL